MCLLNRGERERIGLMEGGDGRRWPCSLSIRPTRSDNGGGVCGGEKERVSAQDRGEIDGGRDKNRLLINTHTKHHLHYPEPLF